MNENKVVVPRYVSNFIEDAPVFVVDNNLGAVEQKAMLLEKWKAEHVVKTLDVGDLELVEV